MEDNFPFARPPYKADGGGNREVFKLRWFFQSMFKANHANKIGLIGQFASMACYTLLENDPLRRHLRAEISFYNKLEDFVESDVLPQGEFNQRIEALFLASRPALAPGGTFPEMASTPQFGLHSSGTRKKREAVWDKKKETLLAALKASEFNDWHTDEARRRADEKPMQWTPRDPDAKKKGGKTSRAKTANLVNNVTNSGEYPGMATLTFDNTDNAQPGSSTHWAATAYPESVSDHGAPPVLSTTSHPPSSFSHGDTIGDGFNNTSAFPAVTSRLAIYPDYSLHNKISGSSPDSEYSSLRVSPTSEESWSGLRAFEPRQSVAVRGMQFTADEEMAIDTDLAITHRLPTLPVAEGTLSSLSLPPPPQKSFPETLSKPTHIVPSHSPHAVAEGAWSYDENKKAHWVPYPPGASFQPQDQGLHQDGSQWYGPTFMQQQPDSQDAPPVDAMEYEATPSWNIPLW